mgnify:CR=1 FL=1
MVSVIKIDNGEGVLNFTLLPETTDKIISLFRPATTANISFHTNNPRGVSYQVPVAKKFTLISIIRNAADVVEIRQQPTVDSAAGQVLVGSIVTPVAKQISMASPFIEIAAGNFVGDGNTGSTGDMMWGIESDV